MLSSILVGLDNSESSSIAQDLGIRWSQEKGCRLTGITIVDDPGIVLREEVLSGDTDHHPVAHALLAEVRVRVPASLQAVQEEFSRRCRQANVAHELLDEVGAPHIQILLEAQKHDLILLGQHSHFEFGWEGKPGETVEMVIQDSPRPVVVTPAAPCSGETIVIAYDGSLQAARTVGSLVETGLAAGPKLHIVAAALPGHRQEAARRAGRAIAFLRAHQLEATPHVIETSHAPGELILTKLHDLDAGLLVMGAYGQPALKEFFLGSVTRSLLKQSPVPIYCFH